MDVTNITPKKCATWDSTITVSATEQNTSLHALEAFLEGLFSTQKAAHYAIFSGGKRLRPRLTFLTTKACGEDPLKAIHAAAAIEMIHTYSLIHDDLPCMDDDDWRRGKPTLHKVFSEGEAVLTGDYLLTRAFQVLAEDSLPDDKKISLIQLISGAAGAPGMIEGQMRDIAGVHISLEELYETHRQKTGAIIAASVQAGAIVAGTDADLTPFAEKLGLAFQIIDDVLDVTAGYAKHGKAAGSDAAGAKVTTVTLLGVEGAQKEADRLYSEAVNALPFKSPGLEALAKQLVYRKL